MKYKTWANLNDEGKAKLGHIFTEGILPIQSISKDSASLGIDLIKKHDIYFIDVHELSKDELDHCIDHMFSKRGGHCGEIRERIKVNGFIPIRAKFISSVGTDKIEHFM